LPEVIKTNYFLYSGVKVNIPDADVCMEDPDDILPPDDETEPVSEPETPVQPPAEMTEPEIRTIIKEIYRDPEPLTRGDIERIYRKEISEICRQAERQAYSDALAAKEEEIAGCIGEVEALLDEIRVAQERYMEKYIGELKYFSIEVAEKMILEKIGEDDLILNKMVLQAVSGMKNSQWLRVEVSDRLTRLTEFLKNELSGPEYLGKASVVPVAAPPDTCRIVSESGATVATVSVQADNLRRAFSKADSPDN